MHKLCELPKPRPTCNLDNSLFFLVGVRITDITMMHSYHFTIIIYTGYYSVSQMATEQLKENYNIVTLAGSPQTFNVHLTICIHTHCI